MFCFALLCVVLFCNDFYFIKTLRASCIIYAFSLILPSISAFFTFQHLTIYLLPIYKYYYSGMHNIKYFIKQYISYQIITTQNSSKHFKLFQYKTYQINPAQLKAPQNTPFQIKPKQINARQHALQLFQRLRQYKKILQSDLKLN